MNNIDIGQRLKAFRERTKIKMPVVAVKTGIAKETLYKWEKGTNPSNAIDYLKLKEYLDKMEDIEQEEFLGLEAHKPATIRLPLDANLPPFTNTDGKVLPGTVILNSGEPELIVYRIYAPILGQMDGALPVIGEAMAPLYASGSLVLINRQKNDSLIIWGQCYFIIDKNWKGIIRRIYQGDSENSLKLLSDNPDKSLFPPIERRRDQIGGIMEVVGVISKF